MDLYDQMHRYFGTADVSQVPPSALYAGLDRMKVDLGLTINPGERFALWALLHSFGSAPDLDASFHSAEDRELARQFMELMEREQGS